jgi:hypothetical protein
MNYTCIESWTVFTEIKLIMDHNEKKLQTYVLFLNDICILYSADISNFRVASESNFSL